MSAAAGTGPALPRALGMATLLLAAGALALRTGKHGRDAPPAPHARPPHARPPHLRHPGPSFPGTTPARGLHGAAALLSASVLADSAVEHARADFRNPGMLTPLLVSGASLLAGLRGARGKRAGAGVYGTALAAGVAGTAFHLYNLLARPGGIAWTNLFWGAPLGAPAALSLAGVLGLGARRCALGRDDPRRAGRALCAIVGAGMAGASAEAAILHFRGAYQNPFMYLPVALPPVAALLLGAQAAVPTPAGARRAAGWLRLSGALGLAGIGFHAYGVHRRMGGWTNLRQNLMSGPPLSAPPGFTALALGGLAALALLDRSTEAP